MPSSRSILFLLVLFLPLLSKSQIKTPQWVIPIQFKDANGDRDTIWLGYHPDADIGGNAYDPDYEELLVVDTTKFHAIVTFSQDNDPGWIRPYTDTVRKTEIMGSTKAGTGIGFIKGKMPITMYWDDTLLYTLAFSWESSDSTVPTSRIDLTCLDGEVGYDNCPNKDNLYLSSYWMPGFGSYMRSDSIVFDGSGAVIPNLAVYMSIVVKPHWDGITFLDKNQNNVQVTVRTDLANDLIKVITQDDEFYQVTLTSITGQTMFVEEISEPESIFNISNLTSGCYVLVLQGSTGIRSFKILKP